MPSQTTLGPLRVHPDNPRYFTDGTGRAVYLTGVHTWTTLQERLEKEFPLEFDYAAYLDFLTEHHHNCFRKWAWEFPRGAPWSAEDVRWTPMPFARSDTRGANDGGNKFDLDRFHQPYFDRLRERVRLAGDRGIYVIVNFFNGAVANGEAWPAGTQNPWLCHPFQRNNNINGVDGDPERTGLGYATHTSGAVPDAWRYQQAYLRKVVDTVNDLDNVLFEVANEDQFPDAIYWQVDVVNYVHEYEATLPKQHPVGVSAIWQGAIRDLYNTPADWIGPGGEAWHPIVADGRKVILWDSDHTVAEAVIPEHVWKAFTNGLNVLSMEHHVGGNRRLAQHDFHAIPGDRAMGRARLLADTLDLAAMSPQPELCSTGYCLASIGREYVIYGTWENPFSLHLPAGEYAVHWIDPVEEISTDGGIVSGGGNTRFRPLKKGAFVMHLKRR